MNDAPTTHPQPLQGGEPENVIHLNAPVLERAELVPIAMFGDQVPAMLESIGLAAQTDQHITLNPTHVMLKGGKIVGYLSLNGLPMVHCWFDSANKHATDSLKMIEHGVTAFRERGVRDFTVACADNSPFAPHMERLGFKKLGTTTLWRKV